MGAELDRLRGLWRRVGSLWFCGTVLWAAAMKGQAAGEDGILSELEQSFAERVAQLWPDFTGRHRASRQDTRKVEGVVVGGGAGGLVVGVVVVVDVEGEAEGLRGGVGRQSDVNKGRERSNC